MTPWAPPTATPSPWTIKTLLDWSVGFFAQKGIADARLDAELLLAHLLGLQRIDLYLQFDRPVNSEKLAGLRELVRERARRVPTAYLVREAAFWDLTLAVGPGVLIPRRETEILVEAVLQAIADLRAAPGAASERLRVLELGTGSGAIPLAVCGEVTVLVWAACERAPEALAYARENRRRHSGLLEPRGNALHLWLGNRFAAVAPSFRPHLIVSNPPYVPDDEFGALQPEIARNEPPQALRGGPDGLDFHRYLLAEADERLAPGGRLLLEIGADQAASLRALLAAHPALREVELRADYAGRDRVWQVEKSP